MTRRHTAASATCIGLHTSCIVLCLRSFPALLALYRKLGLFSAVDGWEEACQPRGVCPQAPVPSLRPQQGATAAHV